MKFKSGNNNNVMHRTFIARSCRPVDASSISAFVRRSIADQLCAGKILFISLTQYSSSEFSY